MIHLELVLLLVSLLMIVVFLASLGQSLRILNFKRRAGNRLAVIGMTPKNGFYLSVAIVSLVYLGRLLTGSAATEADLNSFNSLMYPMCLGSMALLGILGGIDRLTVRENGLSNASLMVTWSEINNYHWDGRSLILDHRNLIFKNWKTRIRLKPNQFSMLKRHLK